MLHTGFISFCDRINQNIKSSDAKDDILRTIESKFNVYILKRHWYHFDERGCEQINRLPHLACLRSNGNPYYLFLSKYEDVPIIYYIDKKIHPGYQRPRIILARSQFHSDLFNGTLIDGEMVKTNTGAWIFLMNDMYGYCGKKLDNTLPERLELLYTMFSTMYYPDSHMDVCHFQVKQYAHATKQGTEYLIELSKTLNYTSRGVYYFPFNNNYRPKLHNFDMSIIKPVIRKVKDVPDFIETINKTTNSSESSNSRSSSPTPFSNSSQQPQQESNDDNIYWIRKTEMPDVYDIHKSQNTTSKIGIASVPTMKVSKMLRTVFKDATVNVYYQFECEYDKIIQKWLPIRYIAS